MSGLISTPAKDVRVGDTVQVWWGSKFATISKFTDHSSRLKNWKVAHFTDGRSMTMTPVMNLRVSKCGT